MDATASSATNRVPEDAVVDRGTGDHQKWDFDDPFSDPITKGDAQIDVSPLAHVHFVGSNCLHSVVVS